MVFDNHTSGALFKETYFYLFLFIPFCVGIFYLSVRKSSATKKKERSQLAQKFKKKINDALERKEALYRPRPERPPKQKRRPREPEREVYKPLGPLPPDPPQGAEGIFVVWGDHHSGQTCRVVRAYNLKKRETVSISEKDSLNLLPGDRVKFNRYKQSWYRDLKSKYPHSTHRKLISTDRKAKKPRYYTPEHGDKVTLSVENVNDLAYFSELIPHTIDIDQVAQYIGKKGIVQVVYTDGAADVQFENGAKILVPGLILTPYKGRIIIKKEQKKKKKKKKTVRRKCVFYQENGRTKFDTVVVPPEREKMRSR